MRLLSYPLVLALALAAASGPAAAAGNFTTNLHLRTGATSAFFNVQDVEPEVRVDTSGRIFVSAIHGVPGGVDLFQVASSGTSFAYRGMPDGLPVFNPTGLAPGGGDTDLAIGSFNTSSTSSGPCRSSTTCVPGPLLITSLNLGTIYTSQTSTGGAPCALPCMRYTPGGNAAGGFVGVDRQWNNAFGGLERYNVVHDAATGNIQFARSLDGGMTWINGTPTDSGILATAAQNNELGPIVVDQNHITGGNIPSPFLYEIFVSGASPADNANQLPLHTVWMAVSENDGATWTDHMVFNGATTTSFNHIFPSMAVDAAGNVYAVWSDDKDVFYSYSTTHGSTWHAARRVTNSAADGGYLTHIFPWIGAGTNGGVDIVYYQTKGANPNLATDQWVVGMAQSLTATSATPNFQYFIPSDHIIHTGQICEGGIGCDSTQPGNRNLADDFQVAIDPQGAANIVYSDDHDTAHPPQTYFVKQIAGRGIGTPNGDGPNRGAVMLGTVLPGSMVAAGLPVYATIKEPQGVTRGWVTLTANRAVVVAGFINTIAATAPNAATFTGATLQNAPLTGSLQAGKLTVTVAGHSTSAAIAGGTFMLR